MTDMQLHYTEICYETLQMSCVHMGGISNPSWGWEDQKNWEEVTLDLSPKGVQALIW